MNLHLREKVIIVFGGVEGIGKAVVSRLALEEAIPVIVGDNKANNEKALQSVTATGGMGFQVTADLSDVTECKNAVDEVMQMFGKIDGLVFKTDFPANESSSQQKYYQSLITHCLPSLKQSKGSIVNVSCESNQGGPHFLAPEQVLEFAKSTIRLNRVLVGRYFSDELAADYCSDEWMKETMNKIPLGKRLTTVEEVANTVAFLLSRQSGHTTGQVIGVDGGHSCSQI